MGGPVVSLAAGSMHTCAVLGTGALRCWGRGEHGQLGLGSTETIGDDEAPTIAGIVDLGEQRASAVFSGPLSSSTCVLLDGEHLRCWGDNDVGQLGYDTTLRLGDDPQEGGGDLPDVIVMQRCWSSSRPIRSRSNPMRNRYLEVTFRRGRMLAAYLYLPRKAGEKSARTVPMEHGLLVDYNAAGMPIGVEITAPERINVAAIDDLLRKLGFDATEPNELAPLRAA